MKILITADVHINSDYPERLQILRSIFKECRENKIEVVILAGDTLDKNYKGYQDLDTIAGENSDLTIIAIPGNHDLDLSQKMFNAKNLEVISEPVVKAIGNIPFLFLPYNNDATMGATIERSDVKDKLERDRWVLISHGDFIKKRKSENGNETGYYPLAKEDVQAYRPAIVIMGHIHLPSSYDNIIYYPGSPYPVDSSELGQRSALVLDCAKIKVDRLYHNDAPVPVRITITLIPDGNEITQIKNQLETALSKESEAFQGQKNDFSNRCRPTVIVQGYAKSREGITDAVINMLAEKSFKITKSFIDISGVSVADENNALRDIAVVVAKKIEGWELSYDDSIELKKAAVQKALGLIYGK